ncbi:MAG: RidA family protein [Myxococcota bacterium]
MRELLMSANLPKPLFRYTPMVKAGPFYQMAGAVGLKPDGSGLVSGGPEAETRQILENLQRALPDFGLSLENLISATIYTTEFGKFAEINRAWEAVFTADVPPPARTSIGVAALPAGATVEIEFRLYKE